MSIIQYKEANCKNCYKCIRNCPVKAISFRNDQTDVIEEDCTLCGNCLTACPQNAKTVRNDIAVVKKYISKKDKVYVSLAPSFISAFENNSDKLMYAALKKLGFTHVEETAVGASMVSRQYEQLLHDRKMKNIITTACPSSASLVQKYYPGLVGFLAPVVSPMIAHAKMLRETYGSRIKVVFIGPCLAKKDECNDFQNDFAVDAVLTFEDLEEWMQEEGIYINGEYSESVKASRDTIAKIYPVPGGILRTIDNKLKKNYKCISVDGVERCMNILDSMMDDDISGYFIEMNSCTGACMGGPCMKKRKGGYLEAREKLIDYVRKGSGAETSAIAGDTRVDLSKKFFDRSKKAKRPSDATIQGILNSIGKYTPDKELNCGACGYHTCRDKAVAVYNGKAQLHMCLPYMRERAESISNIIINITPNAIFALDSQLVVQELNTSAQTMFSADGSDLRGKNIYEVLQCPDISMVLESRQSIFDSKYEYGNYGMTVEQSIVYVPEQNIVV
ncbi:MAG: 4Fe-4S dicluster domain-containing protein, partial [Clostridiales bacterium]|nr:4Fe-4S dicluster domain-containing protein [Clostridiales bacterium]